MSCRLLASGAAADGARLIRELGGSRYALSVTLAAERQEVRMDPRTFYLSLLVPDD